MEINMDNQLEIINKHVELKKAFSWVIKNNNSNNLPYHNFNHLLTVTKYVYDACKYYKLPIKDEKELLIASIFHDVNHSGGKESDDINLIVAKKSFKLFAVNIDIDQDEVCRIIDATQYPYVIDAENMDIKQQIIRDADLMQVFEYNWIQQNMMGLSKEMNITLDKMITGQRSFLMNSKFNTEWGNIHKDEKWDDVNNNLTILEDLYKLI